MKTGRKDGRFGASTKYALRANALHKAADIPGADDLAAINRLTRKELGPEDVYVARAWLAHNAIDRDAEVFDDALLADFANTLPGKGLFNKHPASWDGDSGPGVGRWFSARVVTMSLDQARIELREPGLKFPPGTTEAKLLEAAFYIPRSGKNADLIADVDAGVASDVSIGFRAADSAPITQGDNQVLARRLVGPGEAFEGSLVWLGAQPGARVHKSADRGANRENDEGKAMDLEQELKTVKADNDRLKTENTGLIKKAALAESIEGLLGKEWTDGTDAAERIAQAVNDGKAYRGEILDDIVRLERLAKMLGDKDEDVAGAKEMYGEWPLAKLKAYRDKLDGMSSKGGQLGGSDPNATGANQADAERQADDGKSVQRDPTRNPLISGKAA